MMEKEQLIRFIEGIVTKDELNDMVAVEDLKEMGEKIMGRIDVQQEQLDGLQALLGGMQLKMTQMQMQIVKLEEQLAAKEAEFNTLSEKMYEAQRQLTAEEARPVMQEEARPIVQEEVKPVVQEEAKPVVQEEVKPQKTDTTQRLDVPDVEQTQTTTIAESIKGEESLAEKLSRKIECETVASSINASKIERMQTAITIADRFRFQRELFGGDAVKMAETVQAMNGMRNMDEALAYLDKRFKWDVDSAAAMDFIKIVERRF